MQCVAVGRVTPGDLTVIAERCEGYGRADEAVRIVSKGRRVIEPSVRRIPTNLAQSRGGRKEGQALGQVR